METEQKLLKLQNETDDTDINLFNGDMNDPMFMNYLEDLHNIVADMSEKVDNIPIDDKYVRNNVFDFTKTMKT